MLARMLLISRSASISPFRPDGQPIRRCRCWAARTESGEVHAPEYILLVSDLGGEKRFISTIARRMGSLGALSKGQKNANVGTSVMDKANFETDQGRAASTAFYDRLRRDIPVPGTNLTGMQVLHDLGVLKQMPDGSMGVKPTDKKNVTKLLNRLMALDPDIQNAVYNYFYDIFEANVQDAIEDGTLDTGVKSIPGDEFHVKEQRLLATDPETGAQTFYYPTDAKVRLERVSPADLEKRITRNAENNARIMRNDKGRVILAIDAAPVVHADGRTDPAIRFVRPGNGHWTKIALNDPTFKFQTIPDWAEKVRRDKEGKLAEAENTLAWTQTRYDDLVNDEKERKVNAAQSALDRAERTLERYRSAEPEPSVVRPLVLTGNTYSNRFQIGALAGAKWSKIQNAWNVTDTPENRAILARLPGVTVGGGNTEGMDAATAAARIPAAERDVVDARRDLEAAKAAPVQENEYWKSSLDQAKAKVAELSAPVEEARKIAERADEWGREAWEEQYESAPSHTSEEYHLIGGAVLRYWSAIKEASPLLDIYTTVDTKTGRRVVGVSVMPQSVNALLARISGSHGVAAVTAPQMVRDVLINGSKFTLENGIRVQRGRVARVQVIQLITSRQPIIDALRDMGVQYEKGVTPILYIPTAAAVQTEVLRKVLAEYPVIPEIGESDAPTEPLGEDYRPSRKQTVEGGGPIWYSQLEHAIADKMPARADAKQVFGIVSNPQNGVKPDELRWSGLVPWLQEQKGPVTKEQVLDFVRANAVQVKEVLRGGPTQEACGRCEADCQTARGSGDFRKR